MHTMAERNNIVDVSWQGRFQGNHSYTPRCEYEVLIIIQDENLDVPDAVSRRTCELAGNDKLQLERLNISINTGYDDASIMAARYALDKQYTGVHIEKSTSQNTLSKSKILQLIRDTMMKSTKSAISIRYCGPGKKHTGDWCFEDGFITFEEIVEYYHLYFKGKILRIHCDCSYSGSWVKACMEYLDKQGVQPCVHSAKEKELFISVAASCKHTEIPHQLLFSIRAYVNDKNTGHLGKWSNGWKVAEGQHIQSASVDGIKCQNKSIDDPCTLDPHDTWKKLHFDRDRISIVRLTEEGCPAWKYILLVDDDEIISKFDELTRGPNAGNHTIDLSNYGQVLKSGWGHSPPNDIKEWMKENYGTS